MASVEPRLRTTDLRASKSMTFVEDDICRGRVDYQSAYSTVKTLLSE